MQPTPLVPLGVFQVILLISGVVACVLAAVGWNGGEDRRVRLLAAGLACWIMYALLLSIGGLVR